ncbi:cutinase [Gordonia spumicola]|uniref:Cutinase n=1 Tax=Gordonia spumicola TaxID=589161 RepID=A0A7I9V5L8_9ACTN|nr:cutinase family protein [Gordonia spumicola]GEE00433.1 cutinase [Gordonia spumicola]
MSRNRTSRRRKLGTFALLVGLLGLIALVLVAVLVFVLLRPSPTPPGSPTSLPPSKTTQRPSTQPADCSDVFALVIPGTWESKANDDPYNPTANPRSLMLKVSSKLRDEFPTSTADVYTLPYKARFRNPTNLADRQATYDDSRAQGKRRAVEKLTAVHAHCPLTKYVVMGFSQGAVIAGDIASDIGNGRGPLPAQDEDLVIGVGLIADGRRQSGQQNDVGPSPAGVGAEVSLGGFGSLVPGTTMTGSRSGGFGTLRDRTYSICAKGDLICDAPTVTNPLKAIGDLANAVNNPVHAMYATPKYWTYQGKTATQWMLDWSADLIRGTR